MSDVGDAERRILKEIQNLAVETSALKACSVGVRDELKELWTKVDSLRTEVFDLTTEVALLKNTKSLSKPKKIVRDGGLAAVGASLAVAITKIGALFQ